MVSRYLIPVLVAMMLVTGVCNTLLTKYQVSDPIAARKLFILTKYNCFSLGYAMCA
jgi:hypothetical protein